MQHLTLFPRQVTGNAFPEEALRLLPLYKLKPVNVPPASSTEAAPAQFSSPVCYAHVKGFREGFEE